MSNPQYSTQSPEKSSVSYNSLTPSPGQFSIQTPTPKEGFRDPCQKRETFCQTSETAVRELRSKRKRTVQRLFSDPLNKRFRYNPKGKEWPVIGCGLDLQKGKPAVEIWHSSSVGSTHYKGLCTCKSVWTCPTCAAKIKERRRAQIEAVDKALIEKGYFRLFMTQTLSHHWGDKLGDVLSILLTAQAKMLTWRAYRDLKAKYGMDVFVRGLEPILGPNGPHPHCHSLLWYKSQNGELTGEEREALESELKGLWMKAIAKSGGEASWEHGLWLEKPRSSQAVKEYIQKLSDEKAISPDDLKQAERVESKFVGEGAEKGKWTIFQELVNGHTKRSSKGFTPWMLLDVIAGDSDSVKAFSERIPDAKENPIESAEDAFIEYANAMYGRQQLVWSGGYLAIAGIKSEELTDEQLIDQPEEGAELIYSIESHVWRLIRFYSLYDRLLWFALSAAEKGKLEAIPLWIDKAIKLMQLRAIDPDTGEVLEELPRDFDSLVWGQMN